MFSTRVSRRGSAGVVEVVFTDRHGGVSATPFDSLDLGGAAGRERELKANADKVAQALGVLRLTFMHQVHGREVTVVGSSASPEDPCDAMVTDVSGVALCVRVADCVPVVLADADKGVVGVAHAGRAGVAAKILDATVATMRTCGAEGIQAWVGPHVCGGCYEVPGGIRAEVSAVVPAAYSCTTWGTPALDLGVAASRQLRDRGCTVTDVGCCTLETSDLFSFRRDGEWSGRFAGIVVLSRTPA